MNTKLLTPLAAAITLALSGCATNDPYQRTKTGAVVGAVTGAVIGHQISHGKGAWVGAAVGALAGGAIGNYMDNQQQEFEAALAYEQQQHQLEIERLQEDTLRLILDSEITFNVDSARIKPSFYRSLDKMADLLIKYDRSMINVVGHTDNTGSADYNYRLSQQRAESVVNYLQQRGVPYGRLRAEGRGENDPIASNATPEGRRMNRRVELYVRSTGDGGGSGNYQSQRY